MKDVMVDLETMGTDKNAMITQIGACYFDRNTGEIGDTFSVNVSMEDSFKQGFVIDPGAVKFWLFEQNRTFLNGNTIGIKDALEQFFKFVKKAEAVWSHATFDFVLIKNACDRMGVTFVSYRTARDIRTLVDMAGLQRNEVDNIRKGAHDALSDCIYQVEYCVKAMRKINGNDN